jgi:hypothetical protein
LVTVVWLRAGQLSGRVTRLAVSAEDVTDVAEDVSAEPVLDEEVLDEDADGDGVQVGSL